MDMARFKVLSFPSVSPGDRIAATSPSRNRVFPAAPADPEIGAGYQTGPHSSPDCEEAG